MSPNRTCPYCRYPVKAESIALWDGNDYCVQCVREVSPDLLHLAATQGALQDTAEPEDLSVYNYATYMTRGITLFATCVFGVPFGIMAALGAFDWWVPVAIVLAFSGFGALFFLLQGSYGIGTLRKMLPRIVEVRDREIEVSYADDEETGVGNDEEQIDDDGSVLLQECTWYYGTTSYDPTSWFTSLRKGTMLQTANYETPFAIGYRGNNAELWRAFLTLSRIPYKPPRRVVVLLLLWLVTCAMVVALAYGVGCLVDELNKGQGDWVAWITYLGMIGGMAIGLSVATLPRDESEAIQYSSVPHRMGFVTFILSLGALFAKGVVIALACASVNAAIVCLAAMVLRWYARWRIATDSKETGIST